MIFNIFSIAAQVKFWTSSDLTDPVDLHLCKLESQYYKNSSCQIQLYFHIWFFRILYFNFSIASGFQDIFFKIFFIVNYIKLWTTRTFTQYISGHSFVQDGISILLHVKYNYIPFLVLENTIKNILQAYQKLSVGKDALNTRKVRESTVRTF